MAEQDKPKVTVKVVASDNAPPWLAEAVRALGARLNVDVARVDTADAREDDEVDEQADGTPGVPAAWLWLWHEIVWKWTNLMCWPLITLVTVVLGRTPGWLSRAGGVGHGVSDAPVRSRTAVVLHGLVHVVSGLCFHGRVPDFLCEWHDAASARVFGDQSGPVDAIMDHVGNLLRRGRARVALARMPDRDVVDALLAVLDGTPADKPEASEVVDQAIKRLIRSGGGPLTPAEWQSLDAKQHEMAKAAEARDKKVAEAVAAGQAPQGQPTEQAHPAAAPATPPAATTPTPAEVGAVDVPRMDDKSFEEFMTTAPVPEKKNEEAPVEKPAAANA